MDDKNKRIRDVIYPEIKQCEEYVSDIFWKKLFDDMSRGKCPKNIVIFNNTVSSVYKRNGFIYDFKNKDSETIAQDLVEILKTQGCIYSLNDLKNEQKERDGINIKYESWKQIKTRKIKQQYIHDFVLKQSQKYKLNDQSSKSLINMINFALTEFRTHRSDDIEFKNNEITNIKDIYYDKDKKTFINKREPEDKEEPKKNVNILKKSWENFIIKSYREYKQILK
uniref:Uncharacterized protein n=1 Tax=viral metagenome TaxID=1070528 RepID=A0A6C0HF94_9ZZZZ